MDCQVLGSDPLLLKESRGTVSFLPIMDYSAESEVHGETVSAFFVCFDVYFSSFA